MLIFSVEEVPEMSRGKGVRLQRFKDGGLCDARVFKRADGLSWLDAAGRTFSVPMTELRDWVGERAQAGRLAPRGFPKSNKFGPAF
jgi:topoisomerase IV subunit A